MPTSPPLMEGVEERQREPECVRVGKSIGCRSDRDTEKLSEGRVRARERESVSERASERERERVCVWGGVFLYKRDLNANYAF